MSGSGLQSAGHSHISPENDIILLMVIIGRHGIVVINDFCPVTKYDTY
jgi:hypothetical protein